MTLEHQTIRRAWGSDARLLSIPALVKIGVFSYSTRPCYTWFGSLHACSKLSPDLTSRSAACRSSPEYVTGFIAFSSARSGRQSAAAATRVTLV